ncbi:MAG TPA: 2-C-methyl-D-erythritol 2,4-cyclodiphosphate synthase [Gemmatimonadaceae bacterium]|nr:2-C-methyl-D-erythritol 2,4-cyclodiphosphate synthase [Gemmatimonadaceae bacterium]
MPPERRSIVRTGIGYDSHCFAPGAALILGGVSIPHERGLVGHSDADAVAHALTDAILGAASEGDIGSLFPNTDPANKNRNSLEMLQIAVDRVESKGFVVANADIVVIAEQPAIGPHRDAMRTALARVLHISADAVSVKGKSNEGMGWIGRGEGIACIAIAGLAERGE